MKKNLLLLMLCFNALNAAEWISTADYYQQQMEQFYGTENVMDTTREDPVYHTTDLPLHTQPKVSFTQEDIQYIHNTDPLAVQTNVFPVDNTYIKSTYHPSLFYIKQIKTRQEFETLCKNSVHLYFLDDIPFKKEQNRNIMLYTLNQKDTNDAIGFISYYFSDGSPEDGEISIDTLQIHEDFYGKGFGTYLLSLIKKYHPEIDTISLGAVPDTVKFYHKLGFVFSEEDEFYDFDKEETVISSTYMHRKV